MHLTPHSLISLVFLSMCSGCALPAPSPTSSPGFSYDQAMDDGKFLNNLEKSFNQLVKDNKLTPPSKLSGETQRTKAMMTLPPHSKSLPKVSPADIFQKNAPGTLFFINTFLCDNCHLWHVRPAGAWALTSDGVVVTNEHVVQSALTKTKGKDSPGMAVADSLCNIYPVREILAVSKADDIAIVRVETTGLSPLPVATGAVAGEPVFVLSSPQQRLNTFTNGMITRYFIHREPGQKPVTRVAITAEYATGSSGSPVFNAQGAVIGMISSTSSLSAETKTGNDRDTHQMVVRNCVPVEAVLKMIEAP